MAELTRGEFLYQLDQFVSTYEDAGLSFDVIAEALREYIAISEDFDDDLR